MEKVPDLFSHKQHTFSFELFPPKTDDGFEKLKGTIQELAALHPDFISCTYGAGGGNRDKTFDIIHHIQEEHHIIGVAHLTCVLHTKDEIKNILIDIKNMGINNVLALRGDTPKDNPNWTPGENNFKYSSELCAFIRKHFGRHFGIGVAGFPEGHVDTPNITLDAQYLKHKIDSGADFVITQLFFNNVDYFEYLKRLEKVGVGKQVRVIPGIIPITDYNRLLNFCATCGATVTNEVKMIFEPIKDDKDKVMEEGIKFAVRQCKGLLAGGAPGLHFYCLNKSHPVDVILREVRG